MFDLRYHVASLAAVFLMLVVGILIGVGISGRGFVDDAERKQLNGRIAGLQEELEGAQSEADDLRRRQQAAADFVSGAYPVLAERRLQGKRIGVVVVGSVPQNTLPFVEGAVLDAGGDVNRIRAIEVPLRVDAVESALRSRPALGGYVGENELGNLGRDLGRELVAGGETPLWDALESEIVEQREGENLANPVDGVVVIRSAEPQQGETSRFLGGLYRGLNSTGVPVVGVEPSRVEQSAIPVFQRYGLSTVDSVDDEPGQLALLLLLGGADPGDYGVRDTAADGILPPIEPLPPPSD